MKTPTQLFILLTTRTILADSRSAAFHVCQRKSLFHSSSRNSFVVSSKNNPNVHEDPDFFLGQVEATVQKVLSRHHDDNNNNNQEEDILALPSHEREAVGVARHLNKRLQALRRNNDCPRCWMQRAHCICPRCPPVDTPSPRRLRRLFLLMHHKEIAMKVDTAKLILAAFPHHCRLVVGGIGPEYQDSMKEMMQAIMNNDHCLVLFPDEMASTFQEIVAAEESSNDGTDTETYDDAWDVIVIDGTWAQARKLQARYLPEPDNGGPRRVKLSQEAVNMLQEQGSTENAGHQLRRHSITWRQVGTFEATRLFLRDLFWDDDLADGPPVWEKIQSYQEIANQAAKRELGPPRTTS